MRAPPTIPEPIAALQAEVDRLWARTRLGRAVTLLWDGTREDDAPFVEHDGEGGRFRVVQWERGRERPDTGWLSLDEAAAWALEGMAAGRAQAAELMVRGTGGYSRLNWMVPAVAIMARVSPAHGAALARRYAAVLASHPLNDEERRAARFPLPGS